MKLQAAVAAVVAGGGVALLAGCGLLPPSADDLAGTYSADETTVVMAEDGTCTVANFPETVEAGDDGEPVYSGDRFDADCTWKVEQLLYSGSWELEVTTAAHGDLNLEWVLPIGGPACLIRPLGDPDGSNLWELCPA